MFIIITALYAKLYVFLRRPDKIRSPYSNSPTGSLAQEAKSRLASVQFRPIGVVSNWFKKPSPEDFTKENVLERRVSVAPGNPTLPQAEKGGIPTDFAKRDPTQTHHSQFRSISSEYPDGDIPPWERVELPAFQVDGQRYGGVSTNISSNTSSHALWGNWKGLSGGSRDKKRPSTQGSSSSNNVQTTRNFGSGSSVDALSFTANRMSPTPRHSTRLGSNGSPPDKLTYDDMTMGMDQSLYASRGSISTTFSGPSDRFRQFSLTSNTQPSGAGLSPMEAFRRSSAVTQDSRRSSGGVPAMRGTTPANLQPSPPDSDGERPSSTVDVERTGTSQGERGPKDEMYEEGEEGASRRTGEEQEDDNWDLMRMLQQSGPPRHAHDKFAPREGEVVEFVEESMASYLNRKTALLMLWFPLGVSDCWNKLPEDCHANYSISCYFLYH